MVPSQQNARSNPQSATSQRRYSSFEGFPGYSVQSHDAHYSPATYGQYAMAGSLPGAYQNPNLSNEPGWVATVLEEIKDLLILTDAGGRITYASPSAKQITGRAARQLEGTVLAHLIHDDDQAVLKREMDKAIARNRTFRTHVRLQKTSSTYALIEIYGHPHIAHPNDAQPRITASQERCLGFFLMCRPQPTKSSLLLDSFLEHKIENARLVQQIAKLKQEEKEATDVNRTPYTNRDPEKTYLETPSAIHGILSDHESSETVAANSEDSEGSPVPDHSNDRAPFEGLSHISGIEVMTGLHYSEGERSQGISTGASQGRLIQCDIDVTTSADQARSVQEGDRRKRLKGQHICSDCQTADSPEWRKGPNGPKTLCNACGLRWSKKEKKRQESS
ncbi:hypothetical protein N7470_000233 [Penicillium chermesinum]|nr:hypothetical protein N7470_000233 [Penicillium chermesinum]